MFDKTVRRNTGQKAFSATMLRVSCSWNSSSRIGFLYDCRLLMSLLHSRLSILHHKYVRLPQLCLCRLSNNVCFCSVGSAITWTLYFLYHLLHLQKFFCHYWIGIGNSSSWWDNVSVTFYRCVTYERCFTICLHVYIVDASTTNRMNITS